ncbi:hypothetical protein [Phreatobacter stygius]|uniref:Uncharacterized protein n=1 Tax=Phreatobacter stygius TaxID=1940610 RepID=A0A4D7AV65_9HYPH|nr:hypothetical protein [Phreatobacter stygius]QCI63475.1 hypothetical protein E8M01_04015 [Phreatobacter stygius]
MEHDLDQTPDLLLEVVDECVRAGRRRNEIAAFLAREYGLDAGSIARLIADHGARQTRQAVSAGITASAALYLAVLSLLQRQAQEPGELMPLMLLA